METFQWDSFFCFFLFFSLCFLRHSQHSVQEDLQLALTDVPFLRSAGTPPDVTSGARAEEKKHACTPFSYDLFFLFFVLMSALCFFSSFSFGLRTQPPWHFCIPIPTLASVVWKLLYNNGNTALPADEVRTIVFLFVPPPLWPLFYFLFFSCLFNSTGKGWDSPKKNLSPCLPFGRRCNDVVFGACVGGKERTLKGKRKLLKDVFPLSPAKTSVSVRPPPPSRCFHRPQQPRHLISQKKWGINGNRKRAILPSS